MTLFDLILPIVQRFISPTVALADASPFPKEDPIVIVGGGVMGSSVAYNLSKRGKNAVLVDSGRAVRGSWGYARSVHLCQYTSIRFQSVKRAIPKFRALEQESGLKILHPLGGSPILCPNEKERSDWIETLDRFGVSHCDLIPSAFHRISPGLNTLGNDVLWVDKSFIGNPENAIEAMRTVAESNSCLIEESTVVEIDRREKTIRTDEGTIINYSKLVLAGGAWTNKLLQMADLKLMPIVPTLEQIFYFNPKPGYEHMYQFENFVNSYYMVDDGRRGMYFYPDIGANRLKVALHLGGPILSNNDEFIVPPEALSEGLKAHCYDDPGILSEATDATDERMLESIQNGVRLLLPYLNPDDIFLSCRCFYANTTDGEWIVGHHPEDNDVILVSGFNGEGFKHNLVVGEFVADLLTDTVSWDGHLEWKEKLSPQRFETSKAASFMVA